MHSAPLLHRVRPASVSSLSLSLPTNDCFQSGYNHGREQTAKGYPLALSLSNKQVDPPGPHRPRDAESLKMASSSVASASNPAVVRASPPARVH